MKGLLIKDYRLVLGQKQFLAIVALLGVLYLAIYDDPTFAIMFITIMCGIFSISTISYDDQNNGLAYLFTLPVSRKEYVLEKYIFVIVSSLISGFVMFLGAVAAVNIRGMHVTWSDLYMGLVSAWLVVMLVVGYMIPLQLKYGVEKSRIVLMSGIAVIFLAVYLITELTIRKDDNWAFQFIDRLEDMSQVTVIILILTGTVVVTVISGIISMKVMEKREF